MPGTTPDSLLEAPRDRYGALSRLIPDTPWTTTILQAMRNRRASVYMDSPENPLNLVAWVRGDDGPGDHDQAYLFGKPGCEALRQFVASVDRSTEFVVDAELAPVVQEIHPGAVTRDAVCCWFEQLSVPPASGDSAPVRRLRLPDSEAAQTLIPKWAYRTFESPKEMILTGGCYGVESDGRLAAVAYVADQSIKYARVAAVTHPEHRRKGYAVAALRRLMEHVTSDGRLVCALAARSDPAATKLAAKLGFPQKALLRTYKVVPGADSPASGKGGASAAPAETTSSSAHAQG